MPVPAGKINIITIQVLLVLMPLFSWEPQTKLCLKREPERKPPGIQSGMETSGDPAGKPHTKPSNRGVPGALREMLEHFREKFQPQRG